MRRFFDRSLELARRRQESLCGRIILDPGIGFAQIRAAESAGAEGPRRLQGLWPADLVGLSRKSLFGAVVGDEPIGEMKIEPRLVATLAANLVAAANGAAIFRVHDAAEHLAAFKVFDAIRRA